MKKKTDSTKKKSLQKRNIPKIQQKNNDETKKK